ncbi:MAG: RNA polymerase sigma factor [Bacteroidales bacterium]
MKKTNKTKESILIQEIKNGNQQAFKELVESLQTSVATTAVNMLGNQEEAEDIGQEVFIQIYRSINTFKGEASIKTWAIRITINLCLNAIKKRNKKRWLSLSIFEGKEKSLGQEEQTFKAYEIKDSVDQALQKLEPKFKTVVILRLIEGYSVKETAEILNLPSGTVLSRLARAQKKLKIDLEKTWK